jgi:RimJ/RimL family protein N-acetyltransferase
MSIFLETKRLVINAPELSDFDNMCTLQSDPEVMRYIGHGVRTKELVAESLQMAIDHQQKHGFSLGSVYEKGTEIFIGRAGLIYLAFDDTQPEIEVGYALLTAYWNKGYATELTRALIKWGFQHLSVSHLIGVIRPKNDRSRHVLEKSGMKYNGPSFYRDIEVALYQIDNDTLHDS